MSESFRREEIIGRRVVYALPGMESVRILKDIEYHPGDSGALKMDLYLPPDAESGAGLPVVVFVSGYSDIGFQRMLGCRLKEMGSYVSWGQLTAVSGLAAVTSSVNRPAQDTRELLSYLRRNAASLGLDPDRICIWACSGNVPNALNVLIEKSGEWLKCAVLCYGYMLDAGGQAHVADAAARFGFANPASGMTVDDLPENVPIFVARAGLDDRGLNETIDHFVAGAMRRNLPLTLLNLPGAPHAFDVVQDGACSRHAVERILDFMKFHLSIEGQGARNLK